MGNFDVDASTESSDWQLVLKLIADGGWVKLSGAYRLSTAPDTPTPSHSPGR